MSHITLRVLDGTDRGKIFDAVDVPVTIGREEGNTIQLNDERISRFHLRIQQDHDDLVLTDLESTNGSKVNNEDVQLRILRHGDLITVGRSTLLFGARKEINAHLEQAGPKSAQQGQVGAEDKKSDVAIADKDWQKDSKLLLDYSPPHLPERLSPGQAAKLTEVLEFLHGHVRQVISEADLENRKHNRQVVLDADHWQRLLDAQAYLSEYMRRISEPLE